MKISLILLPQAESAAVTHQLQPGLADLSR